MESHLHKVNELKKPSTIPKLILPTERIKSKQINSNHGSNESYSCRHFLSNISDTTTASNVPNISKLEHQANLHLKQATENCIKSMNQRTMKMTPISSKSSISQNSVSSTSSMDSGACYVKTFKSNINDICKESAQKNLKGRKDSSNLNGKTLPGKRIPAYDYKARFNDLMEKHKVLKCKLVEAKDQLSLFDNLPEQYEKSQNELFTCKEELKNARAEVQKLQRQNKTKEITIDSLIKTLNKAKESLGDIVKRYKKLLSERSAMKADISDLRGKYNEFSEKALYLSFELNRITNQLLRANTERKELHNIIMDLRGNIRVFCRVRPALESEQDRMLCGWNYLDETTLEICNIELLASGAKNKIANHTFSFDHVFHQKSTQEDIFEMVSPLIQSALDGYNICIFAYGQTGSGKTFTMDGIPNNVGVIPRTVDLLFDSIKNYKDLGWEYEIKATFLEIYNEVLYDLLSNEQKDMDIRMAKNKTDIYVSNITEETVMSANQLRHLMHIAKMNRATAATAGNERSSRSHAVTRIELAGRHNEKNEVSIGTINLVDLAGSESPKTSIRMNETKNINRSLSELTNVILALLQKQDHIPYRNSKLTHLLMPSLGGNSKTLMFINVAPFQDCFVESVKSLRFASSVNACKVTKAKKNRILNTSNSSLL